MSKLKFSNILNILFFSLAIILSFCCVIYLTKYDVLIKHDLVFSYGRTFLEPEHGRYIATFINNLLTEIIPEYLNIHPNDFKPVFVSPFKGILLILICLLFSCSTFIFSSKKRNIAQVIFSPANTVIYSLIFLATFNNFFFFTRDNSYFSITESTVFFEYPCSFLVFIPFVSLLAYYYSNKINPSKNIFYLLYCLAFFTAISIDIINIPTFGFISFLGLASLIENRNKLKSSTKILKHWLLTYTFYFLGILIYFIRPIHHYPTHGIANNIIEYFNMYFAQFFQEFTDIFMKEHSILLVPTIIFLILSLLFSKKDKKAIKSVLFISILAITFFCFIFSLFLLGFIDTDKLFWAFYPKWISQYKIITLLVLLMSFDLFIGTKIKNSCIRQDLIKIITGIIILIIFHKVLITENFTNMQLFQNQMKDIRTASYNIEKLVVNEKTEKVNLPKKYEKYKETFFLYSYDCSIIHNIKNVHPNTTVKDFEFVENNTINNNLILESELNKLKFQDLLTEKMYRHKKYIKNCY